MNTPNEHGKAFSETIKRTTKEVRMIMTGDQLNEAISEWLVKNIPQFRNMPIELDWHSDGTLEIISVREQEEKT